MEAECECCVCMTTADDDESPKLISECDHTTPDDVLLFSACVEVSDTPHFVCKRCLVRMATSFGQSHPIGPRHPMIRCPYPFETCMNGEDLPNYFANAAVERLLLPEDRERFQEHVAKYQFPGFELVSCPRPLLGQARCGAGILVELDAIAEAKPGTLVIQCDQNIQCQSKSCYHCHSLVQRHSHRCETCLASHENTNPNAFNRYFYRPDKRAGDGQPNLFRNFELNSDIVIQQILEMVDSERMESKCTECLTVMQKTEQCNTLEHCKLERCYSCGRSGMRSQGLGDHWDTFGVTGCPRFDNSLFWNNVAECDFKCNEGSCYGDELGDCTISTHQAGIQAMIAYRKKAHIYHALLSLPVDLRSQVYRELYTNHPRARNWLPLTSSSDYRTYVADIIPTMRDKAQVITENFDEVEGDEVAAATYHFAREFYQKASDLTVIAVPDDWRPVAVPVAVTVNPPNKKIRKHIRLFDHYKAKYPKPVARRSDTPVARRSDTPGVAQRTEAGRSRTNIAS